MRRFRALAMPAALLSAAACAGGTAPLDRMPFERVGLPPELPDAGWGVHVLALAEGPDHTLWAGTYGNGIFVLPPVDTSAWQQLAKATA